MDVPPRFREDDRRRNEEGEGRDRDVTVRWVRVRTRRSLPGFLQIATWPSWRSRRDHKRQPTTQEASGCAPWTPTPRSALAVFRHHLAPLRVARRCCRTAAW